MLFECRSYFILFFFFKQKTAYEMSFSDWSSDVCSSDLMANPGDKLVVHEQLAPESQAFTPQDVEFTVIEESPDWIVVCKPAGLVTHPGAGNWQGTLLNGLLYRYPELAHVARAGIVHRLDKDTSGLLVVARHEKAQTHLIRQLQARTVSREYLALAHGRLTRPGTVKLDIERKSVV